MELSVTGMSASTVLRDAIFGINNLANSQQQTGPSEVSQAARISNRNLV